MKRKSVYPFTAIVGQENMKLALILNVINPSLGGVLIKGEKGTAKSTAVRAIADLLPELRMVQGCRFHCSPEAEADLCDDCRARLDNNEELLIMMKKMKVVELPVNATEDRVVGTLDIETAIRHGKRKFEPGILAEANRNILYVDEINLLDDHVVDVLLDAAAMGINTVEREGISFSHPSRFVLVGTMNPEEGDIRPQLLDRFALSVEVSGETATEQRVEVVRRRLSYEADIESFCDGYKAEQLKLARSIEAAKAKIPSVEISDELLTRVAEIAIEVGVDGHRADIVLIKTAIAYAAFMGRTQVEKEDIKVAARLALPHRMRRRPFEEGRIDWSKVDSLLD